MGSINYQREFGQRTVEVLENGYTRLQELGREVTFLMNCLLGTIVVISEKEHDRTEAARNSFLVGVINQEFLDVLGIPAKRELINKDKLEFIANVRHGIAHQHIEAKNADNEDNETTWSGVIIRNNYRNNNFEIQFTVNELRDFAINLAKKYYEAEA
jgi:hypothetical protein